MSDGQRTLVRVSVAAKRLDCSRQSVYVLIERGRLEAQHIGPRAIRITRDSLERLIERGTTG